MNHVELPCHRLEPGKPVPFNIQDGCRNLLIRKGEVVQSVQHRMNPRRRWLAAGAAWPALVWTGTLRAQANPPVLIGWLDSNSAETGRYMLTAFKEGMSALGWRLGVQYRLEERYADSRVDRLGALAQELAANKPAVILALPSRAVEAAAQAAPTTPIVRVAGDAPLKGLVASLARPGGMVTGLSNVVGAVNQKAIELLVEAMPKLRRVGFLADPTTSGRDEAVGNARRAAERFGFEAVIIDMTKPEDIAPAFVQLAKDKVQALVVLPFVWFEPHMPTIMQLAQAQRWPIVGAGAGARRGALFTYGPDRAALARRAAYYVDRILKGAKPGDLPIEQPTTFDLVINLKTAKALGIVIAPSLRVRATEVIE